MSKERGVFNAIDSGYLREFQLTLYESPDKPDQALELYSFRFDYAESNSQTGTERQVSMDFTGPNAKKVTLRDVRYALSNVVRNMVDIQGTTRELPPRCCVKFVLLWNDKRPRGYQPEGFKGELYPYQQFSLLRALERAISQEAQMDGFFPTNSSPPPSPARKTAPRIYRLNTCP